MDYIQQNDEKSIQKQVIIEQIAGEGLNKTTKTHTQKQKQTQTNYKCIIYLNNVMCN